MKSFGALANSDWALLRIVLVLGVLAFAAACDPFRTAGIAVVPRSVTISERDGDSTAMADAFAIARRIAVDHRLGGYDVTSDHEREEGFVVCHGYGEVSLCGKVQGREVQFRLWQRGLPCLRVPRFFATNWCEHCRPDSARIRCACVGGARPASASAPAASHIPNRRGLHEAFPLIAHNLAFRRMFRRRISPSATPDQTLSLPDPRRALSATA